MNLRTVLFSGIGLLSTGIVGNIALFFFGTSPFHSTWEEHYEAYDPSLIDHVNIDADVASISIHSHDQDDILVGYEGNVMNIQQTEYDLSTHMDENTLYITHKHKPSVQLFGFFNADYDIDVYLPDILFESVSITSSVADIQLHAVQAEHWSIATEVGNVNASMIANTIDAKSEVGNFEFHLSDLNEDLTIQTEVGNINVIFDELSGAIQSSVSTTVGLTQINDLEDVASESNAPQLELRSEVGNISVSINNN
ncbi:hypothetical protein DH09_13415 [Bacillaceae bacterium JMAK1]|nr:hypothetical protein DH09_13415 [Bacillaceae bacterium JMAK1]